MKKVFIVGGNGFARECYYNICLMAQNDPEIVFGGFMGHGGYGHTVDYLDLQKYYMGEVAEHKFKQNEYVVIGAGYPVLRKKIYDELKNRNVSFFTIHIGEPLRDSVEIGEANIFCPPFVYTCNIQIGNANVFNGDVIVGHDSVIGDCNFFGPRSQVLGNTKIGDFNQIGANAILLPHCKIGNNNKIAPLSAVYKGCRDNSYWAGNPAIKVGDIS
ncbi:MAG: transferase [Alphaproteobacteria bacterium]|nr:transferase [Alphaproteobacteria bacterium]